VRLGKLISAKKKKGREHPANKDSKRKRKKVRLYSSRTIRGGIRGAKSRAKIERTRRRRERVEEREMGGQITTFSRKRQGKKK